MAKGRDYAGEYRDRNARAKAAGHKSYGELRRKIETGKIHAQAPTRVTNPLTLAYQQNYERGKAEKWSEDNGSNFKIVYDLETRPLGVSEAHYTRAYYDAFVTMKGKASPELRYWLVELNDYMTEDEYDDAYSEL